MKICLLIAFWSITADELQGSSRKMKLFLTLVFVALAAIATAVNIFPFFEFVFM